MYRQVDLLSYLPPFMRNYRDIRENAATENIELNALWEAVEQSGREPFLHEMSEYGIRRWEKMLSITPKAADTLEERRFRIINRLNSQLPYTYRMLAEHLAVMCGPDGYTMELFNQEFRLKIRIALENRKNFHELREWVKEMIPLNLIMDMDLMYNTHEMLRPLTNAQLSRRSHDGVRITPIRGGDFADGTDQ